MALFLLVCWANVLWAEETAENRERPATTGNDKQKSSSDTDADRGKVTASLKTLSAQLSEKLFAAGYRKRSLAVMKLAEYGKMAKEKQLGSAVQSELSTQLSSHGWIMVERERLIDLLKESELAQSGAIEDDQAADLARLVGADLLVVGSVSEVGDRFLINVRAISKEKGTAVAVQQTEVSSAHLIALSSEAVVLKTRWGATYRSMVAPGWGQFYNEEPIKGGVFLAAELGAVAAAIGLHFAGKAVEDEYNSLDEQDFIKNPSRHDDLEKKRQNLWLARDIMFGAIAGVWLINVLDAAINAKTYVRTETGVELKGAGGGDFRPILMGSETDPAPGMMFHFEY